MGSDIEIREKFFSRVGIECSCHIGYVVCRNCTDYYAGNFKLKPSSKIVRVDHNFGVRFYAVEKVAVYLNKCLQEGKNAYFIGVTDEFGNLIK